MATYTEIYNLHNNSDLRNRVTVACLIEAEAIMGELESVSNHANRLIWARNVYQNPQVESERMFWALVAAHNTSTIEQITGATDGAILTAVGNHVNLFAA